MEESRVNGISVTISTYLVIEILSLRDFSLLFKSHLKSMVIYVLRKKKSDCFVQLMNSNSLWKWHLSLGFPNWNEITLVLFVETKKHISKLSIGFTVQFPTHSLWVRCESRTIKRKKLNKTEVKLTGKLTRERNWGQTPIEVWVVHDKAVAQRNAKSRKSKNEILIILHCPIAQDMFARSCSHLTMKLSC